MVVMNSCAGDKNFQNQTFLSCKSEQYAIFKNRIIYSTVTEGPLKLFMTSDDKEIYQPTQRKNGF